MGYGEFGGGGSVKWKVRHGGNTTTHSDTDPQPGPTDGGQFLLIIKAGSSQAEAQGRTTFSPDGTVRISFEVDSNNDKQIQIKWM